jgi:cytosine/adenosine deaminase-related metal-dependent hydrolase
VESVDLIIAHGTVLTMDAQHRLLVDGAVAVRGTRIVAVDSSATILAQYHAPHQIDAGGKAVLPGLVDTYGHGGHGLIKGLHHPVHGWPSSTLYFHATTEAWWYAEGRLAALERLRAGVTCGYTVVGATPARIDDPVYAARQAQAYLDVGVRTVIGVGPPDPWVSHLPEPWCATTWHNGEPTVREFTFADALTHTATLIDGWHGAGDGRIHVSVHYPYLFGRQAQHRRIPFTYAAHHIPVMIERAAEVVDLARRTNVLLHSHAFVGSLDFALAHYDAAFLQRCLGPMTLLAHSNGLGPREVALLGESGTGIAVVPYTHENLWYGPCPAVALLRAGANVTIATDGTAPYASYDLLRELPRAVWAQWLLLDDQTVLPPGKVLRMVTIDAARALGLGDEIGSLEVGKRADLILIDLDRPHLTPHTNLPRQLLFFANGADVATVIVNGEVVLQDRHATQVDEAEILAHAAEEAQRAFARSNLPPAALAPYLMMDEQFWTGWSYQQ